MEHKYVLTDELFSSFYGNQSFVTFPAKHGEYTPNQLMSSTWTNGGQVAYVRASQSAEYAALIANISAGDHWFGVWG